MNPVSQALTIIGLFFELSSVLYQAHKAFHPFKSSKEKKDEYIEERTHSIDQKIKQSEKSWFWTLFLLFIGLLLQAIAALEIL